MTARNRLVIAAVPALAAILTSVGARCTDAVHPYLSAVGIVHEDAGCASGTALGPSTFQVVGLLAMVLLGVVANSVAVREVATAFIAHLVPTVPRWRTPDPVPVMAGYVRQSTWGVSRAVGSRDPPGC